MELDHANVINTDYLPKLGWPQLVRIITFNKDLFCLLNKFCTGAKMDVLQVF